MTVTVDIPAPRGNGKAQVAPNNRRPPGPLGNTVGLVVPDTAPAPHGDSAPPIRPTEAEKGWWGRWGGWIHTGLDVVGAIPVVGILGDAANAGFYAAEGDYVNAGISGVITAANLIPGGGAAVKGGKLAVQGGKLAIEQTEKQALEEAARLAQKKVAAELAEKKVAKEADEAAAKKAEGTGGGHDKGNPCSHLKRGNGSGEYRGGAHSQTSKPVNDRKDSHHMPAKDASPLDPKDGPAIQMDPKDHAKTSGNGQMPGSADYREKIAELIAAGRWRDAMATEIKDVRKVADLIKDPRKYNQAVKEMLAYYKCLAANGLVK